MSVGLPCLNTSFRSLYYQNLGHTAGALIVTVLVGPVEQTSILLVDLLGLPVYNSPQYPAQWVWPSTTSPMNISVQKKEDLDPDPKPNLHRHSPIVHPAPFTPNSTAALPQSSP